MPDDLSLIEDPLLEILQNNEDLPEYLSIIEENIAELSKQVEELNSRDEQQGIQGLKGLKGDTGEKGERGFAGPQGVPGIQGEKGDTGDVGEKGEKGNDGKSVSLKQVVEELKPELSQRGGGNMNRNVSIGGNSSVLSRYTDINLKAGTNVTFSYVNNNTTKNLDLTIAAIGGSGGGIIRSISSISTNTSAGSTAGTDYVYLCSGTMTLTLPDATLNTNLYTIKNVGTGVITINTTSSQTIDGSLTITLPVQYTSVDVESDGAAWNVT